MLFKMWKCEFELTHPTGLKEAIFRAIIKDVRAKLLCCNKVKNSAKQSFMWELCSLIAALYYFAYNLYLDLSTKNNQKIKGREKTQ